ncbi:MAG: hypothetical protein ACRD1T_05220 [Acidimicrobiia bacterium]
MLTGYLVVGLITSVTMHALGLMQHGLPALSSIAADQPLILRFGALLKLILLPALVWPYTLFVALRSLFG